MPTKPLTLPHLITIKGTHPGLYDDLETLRQRVNLMHQVLGGAADPQASGGITVATSNGVVDVVIIDKHPEVGQEYFIEYDTQQSFATAHTIPLGPARNYRTSVLSGLTTYWRWYKSAKLGGTSNKIVYGHPPTAVVVGAPGTPAVTPGPSQGSGQSQIPGGGYGPEPGLSGQRRFNVL